jgi:prepilin-type N-terminal cleavage/methylation domain-containing protein
MRQLKTNQTKKQRGFTLIELSIVLVIIGLIVGGVLVGQDLIRAAEIRATVGQYEKYNAAINTFRTKYNGMPGDIVVANATAFGLYDDGMTGAAGLGDGNGLVQDNGGANLEGSGEALVFWRHLTDANLIDGNYGGGATLGAGGVPAGADTQSVLMPGAKMGRGNYFAVAATSGLNYYLLSGITAITTAGVYTFATSMTPIESYNIDVKLDDGAPNTGVVIARGTTTPFAAVATSQATWSATPTTHCMTDGADATDTATTYNRGASTGGNTPACILRMRFN